jgi:hypothetical protein
VFAGHLTGLFDPGQIGASLEPVKPAGHCGQKTGGNGDLEAEQPEEVSAVLRHDGHEALIHLRPLGVYFRVGCVVACVCFRFGGGKPFIAGIESFAGFNAPGL